MADYIFFKNKFGHTNVAYQGYMYSLRKQWETYSIWRCVSRKCSGTVKIIGDTLVLLKSHSHESDTIKVKNVVLQSKMKDRALKTAETPNIILNSFYKGKNQSLMATTTKKKNLIDGLTRIRRAKGIRIEKNMLPDYMRKTSNGEKFLLVESKAELTGRILIYATYSNLLHLKHASVWVCDGTFYSCPPEFEQLYTIQGNVRGKFYPLVFCLMERRTACAYNSIFESLKQNIKTQPQFIMVDFEKAILSSIKLNFVGVHICGCFFHFSQIVWRNIQSIGMTKLYKENNKIQLNVKMIVGLAFVPDEKVKDYFCLLLDYFLNSNADECVVSLMFWFEKTFLLQPNYQYESNGQLYYCWSVYKNIINGIIKTSNTLEGWHRSLNALISRKNPSLVELFEKIRITQNNTEINILQSLYSGDESFITNDACFQTCYEYENFNGIDFVMKIAMLLRVKFD